MTSPTVERPDPFRASTPVRKTAAKTFRGIARRLDSQARLDSASIPPDEFGPMPVIASSLPGTRRASMFFDAYPRFYGTSRTAAGPARLNLRYEGIFSENRDIFAGARVLDIASHDGRWSVAALACGAASVMGIEARPELVAHANATMEHYGFDSAHYRFLVGDVHEVLKSTRVDVDVVLCLGFLYHTLRYNDLFHGIRATGARHIIIDTQAPDMMRLEPSVRLWREPSAKQSAAAADALTFGTDVLTGRPNLAAIRTMAGLYGYHVERITDWAGILRDNPDVEACRDYAMKGRVTLRCVDTTGIIGPLQTRARSGRSSLGEQ